jgi:mono/diheme cytochrome c family protein
LSRAVKVSLTVVAVAIIAALLMIVSMIRYGFSAADEPTAVEAFLARAMRRLAVPADLKEAQNPLPKTPEIIAEGLAHFADHCAICHGNDGKGQTSMGPNFYPEVPDLTLAATQSQSDGELFAVIENGVRLTGMPSFGNGTAASAYGSWGLVHFIRHLPELTPEELTRMEYINPKSPAQWEQMQEEAAFLTGGEAGPAPAHQH